jgi:uncharacterized protein YdhG (YjbR/CyaY superfamily)
MSFSTHDEYFASVPEEARVLLERIQAEVEVRVSGAVRCISYSLPALSLPVAKRRRVFFYFAAFKTHIGIYPPITLDQSLIAETAPYRGPKGNLSFPYSQELPLDLIGRVAVALAAQYAPE